MAESKSLVLLVASGLVFGRQPRGVAGAAEIYVHASAGAPGAADWRSDDPLAGSESGQPGADGCDGGAPVGLAPVGAGAATGGGDDDGGVGENERCCCDWAPLPPEQHGRGSGRRSDVSDMSADGGGAGGRDDGAAGGEC